MKSLPTVTISHTTKSYPSLPYQNIKNEIVGSNYLLSLVFVGMQRAQKINLQYRNKSYVPDVLSFPLDKTTGEIFICPAKATQEAKKYNHTPKEHIGFLFIHGLLHLKGYTHGATMESMERKYCSQFNIC